jgi:hypothetical protein
MRSLTQPPKRFRPKIIPSGSPSYGYRHCSKTSCPASNRNGRSVLNPAFLTVMKIISLADKTSWRSVKTWRDSFDNWLNSFFRLCTFRTCPHSTSNRHFRYNSEASAPFVPYAKPRCILFSLSIFRRMSLAISANTSADFSINCPRHVSSSGVNTVALGSFQTMLVWPRSLESILERLYRSVLYVYVHC